MSGEPPKTLINGHIAKNIDFEMTASSAGRLERKKKKKWSDELETKNRREKRWCAVHLTVCSSVIIKENMKFRY